MECDDSIWQNLQRVVDEVPGWSPLEELFSLYHLALLSAPLGGDVLEIGSWCGRSTIALALACRQSPGRRVVACDLFPDRDDWRENADGTYSFRVEIDGRSVGAYEGQTVWREPFKRDIAPLYAATPSLRAIFDRHVGRHGCSTIVDVVRGDSGLLDSSLARDRRFSLIFIDGDHGYQAVCGDLENVEQRLLVGGWLAFDDAFTTYDGVDRAITERICRNPAYGHGTKLTRKMFVARRMM